jgi:flagellar hook-basal body complex protein FliE
MTTIADVTRIVPGIVTGPATPASAAPTARAERPSFEAVLADSIAQVNRLQHDADRAITLLASAGPASLHDTMLAVEQADVSFRLMMQVRNKIVEAYQDVLRMQV